VSQVFVTSETFNANLGGLAGGDTKCAEAATAANLAGAWTAWLSTDAEDARDRIPDAEYRRLDEIVVAKDMDQLLFTNNDLHDAPINVDENLETVTSEPLVWTGTIFDGTALGSNSCNGWTVTNGYQGRAGDATEFDFDWTDTAVREDCSEEHRLYCFFNPDP
jgi:hypothetical protein